MINKKNILLALCAATVSFSAYAMDDQIIDDRIGDTVKEKHAPTISDIKDDASRLVKDTSTYVKDKAISTKDAFVDAKDKVVSEASSIEQAAEEKINHFYNELLKKRNEENIKHDITMVKKHLGYIKDDLSRLSHHEKERVLLKVSKPDLFDFKEYFNDEKAYLHQKFGDTGLVSTIKKYAFMQTTVPLIVAVGAMAGIVTGACHYAYKKYKKYCAKNNRVRVIRTEETHVKVIR